MNRYDKFEVIYTFFDPMDGHIESDYLGDMSAEQILRSYPAVREEDLESAKINGSVTVTLSIASGDMVKLPYMG